MNINQDLNIKIKYLELELNSKILIISKLKDNIEELLNAYPPNPKDKINLDHIKYLYFQNDELFKSNKFLNDQLNELNKFVNNIKYEFLSCINNKDEQLNKVNMKIRYLENTNNSLLQINSKLDTHSNSDNMRKLLLSDIVNKSTENLQNIYKEKEKKLESQIDLLINEQKTEREKNEIEKNKVLLLISELEIKILDLKKENEDLKNENLKLKKDINYVEIQIGRLQKNEERYLIDIQYLRNEIYNENEKNCINKEKISKFQRIAYGKLT